MMENGDFLFTFNDGARFSQSAAGKHFVDAKGAERLRDEFLPPSIDEQLAHARDYKSKMTRLESAIGDILGEANFPCTIGRRGRNGATPRPKSAPAQKLTRHMSPVTTPVTTPREHTSSVSNCAIVRSSPSGSSHLTPSRTSPQISRSEYPTPPSTFASCRSSSKKSKIIVELNSLDYEHIDNPFNISYACLKSNGNFEFQSGTHTFIDKIRQAQIRVRNHDGHPITYEVSIA